MTDRPLNPESLHLHLHRTASGAYPVVHLYLDEEERPGPRASPPPTPAARPLTGGPINVETPGSTFPVSAKLTGSSTVVICGSGQVYDPTVCAVWAKVYTSPSGIPPTNPADAVPANVGSGKWTISNISFPLLGSGQTYYCAIWYRYVVSGVGYVTYLYPPISFTLDTSQGKTECESPQFAPSGVRDERVLSDRIFALADSFNIGHRASSMAGRIATVACRRRRGMDLAIGRLADCLVER